MSGVVTAGLLIAIVVGAGVGALTGQILSVWMANGALLAIISGLVGVVAAALVRNTLLMTGAAVGVTQHRVPTIVILFATVASIAGSLSGLYIASSFALTFPWWVVGVAGLFSSILMALLILAYAMDPSRTARVRP